MGLSGLSGLSAMATSGGAAVPPPDAPTVAITDNEDGTASVSCTDNADSATAYEIDYRVNAGSWTSVDSGSLPFDNPQTVSGLNNGDALEVRARVQKSGVWSEYGTDSETIANLETETEAWAAAVVTNSGTASAATIAAMNDFVVGAKAGSIWTKLTRCNLFCGDQLAACAVPVAGSGNDTLVNFVSGDYTEATGLTGDGTTKYLNTGLTANTLSANSTHLTVVNQSSAAGSAGKHGAEDGTNRFSGFTPWTDMLPYVYQYDSTAGQGRLVGTAVMRQSGVLTMSRTASNSHAVYANGRSIGSNTTSGGSLPARAIYIFAINNGGTPSLNRADTLQGYTIGSGLTAAEAKLLANLLMDFNVAIGRGAFLDGYVTSGTDLNAAEDVLIDGNYAYVACRDGGTLTVVDITDPQVPSVVEVFTDADLTEAMGVAKNGNTIYLTSFLSHKLICIDATNPLALTKLGSVNVGTSSTEGARKVAYQSGYCYVANSDDGKMYVVDVSNPASPTVTGSVAAVTNAFSVEIVGGYVYCAGYDQTSLKIIDVSNKAAPSVVNTFTLDGGIAGFAQHGNTLLAALWFVDSLQAIDITDPLNPVDISTLATGIEKPNRVVINNTGDYAYLAIGPTTGNTAGVRRVNITNPASMTADVQCIGTLLNRCYGVTIDGEHLFAVARDADSFAALRIAGVSE
jgi:hypothetical protein